MKVNKRLKEVIEKRTENELVSAALSDVRSARRAVNVDELEDAEFDIEATIANLNELQKRMKNKA